MPPALKVKTAGLPRWAWIAMFTGAVGIGLYLRHKHSMEEEPPAEEEEASVPEDTLEGLEGTESAGGLAAAGLVGPAQGQITPVEAPYIPQGFVDIFESQDATIGALAEREPGERVETIREVEPIGEGSNQGMGGGGPSNRKPHHAAPKKPKAKKPHNPARQRPPKKHRKPPRKRRQAVGKGHPAR